MKKVILIVCCLSGMQFAYAQKLPMSIMCKHLLECGEAPQCDSISVNNISYSRIVGTDSVALFLFSNSSPHNYFYLLLKNKNRYKILNCDDLGYDWVDIKEIFGALALNFQCDDIFQVAELYHINAKIHPSPPKPIFKDGNFTGKTEYLPRTIIPTSSVVWE
jgi:hypothetical protein